MQFGPLNDFFSFLRGRLYNGAAPGHKNLPYIQEFERHLRGKDFLPIPVRLKLIHFPNQLYSGVPTELVVRHYQKVLAGDSLEVSVISNSSNRDPRNIQISIWRRKENEDLPRDGDTTTMDVLLSGGETAKPLLNLIGALSSPPVPKSAGAEQNIVIAPTRPSLSRRSADAKSDFIPS